MTKRQRERILKLADFLEGPLAEAERRTGRRKFDMERYSSYVDDPAFEKRAPRKVGVTKELCNTAACALGWATVVFPRSLKLSGEYSDVNLIHGSAGSAEMDAEKFFGMSEHQVSKAFYTGWKRTPAAAAKILRSIAGGKYK